MIGSLITWSSGLSALPVRAVAVRTAPRAECWQTVGGLYSGSSARRQGFSPEMTSYEVHGGKSDSRAGLCPIFPSFSLVMTTPPLLCNHPSPRVSPDDAASHRVLVLVGSSVCGHRVSVKQRLTPKKLEPNLALVLHSGFKSWPAEWIFWLTFVSAGSPQQWRTQKFCSVGVQQIQLRTEDIEKGDLGAVAP